MSRFWAAENASSDESSSDESSSSGSSSEDQKRNVNKWVDFSDESGMLVFYIQIVFSITPFFIIASHEFLM